MDGRLVASGAEFVFLNTIRVVLFVNGRNIVFFTADGAFHDCRFTTVLACHNISLKLQKLYYHR